MGSNKWAKQFKINKRGAPENASDWSGQFLRIFNMESKSLKNVTCFVGIVWYWMVLDGIGTLPKDLRVLSRMPKKTDPLDFCWECQNLGKLILQKAQSPS